MWTLDKKIIKYMTWSKTYKKLEPLLHYAEMKLLQVLWFVLGNLSNYATLKRFIRLGPG